MLKKLLLWAWVVFLPSYSYSESITPYYGSTGNAVTDQSLRWSMPDVLPTPPGLDINTVLYNYTIRKETDADVTVNVQNENASGTGYIFRETDEWKPGSLDGTQINKVIGVGSIPRSSWGDGSIDVTGEGRVEDPTVIYTYTVDPCFDPQFDPNCPGYKVPVPDIPVIDYDELYSALDDENVDLERRTCKEGDISVECKAILEDEEESKSEEELKEEEEEEEKDSKERLEKALAAADNSALFANALAISQVLDSVNAATNINSYYAKSLAGGTYNETVVLVDKQLPESKRGLRNGLAQQLLHNKMIEMQYNR